MLHASPSIPLQQSHQILSTVIFCFAVLHSFLIKKFQELGSRFPEGSVGENLFHFLGEVEIVFGFWAVILFLVLSVSLGFQSTVSYVEALSFTEPSFVFVLMAMTATTPLLILVKKGILFFSRILPFPFPLTLYASCLTLGPLLGSFITEPAAMVVTSLLLKEFFFEKKLSFQARYITLGVLFVNISIGGVLTHFAAPPVVMVATSWKWDLFHMLKYFGWKSSIAVTLNSLLATIWLYPVLSKKSFSILEKKEEKKIPFWLTTLHLILLFSVIIMAKHPILFFAIFLLFLGMVKITQEYQEPIQLQQALLVGFFLAGLVILGNLQRWWIEPILSSSNALSLFLGTTLLTAITDNAAITYLGSQVSQLSSEMQYALVAGAVSGGGLTVIANAPNPIGFSILKNEFGPNGIQPIYLLLAAIPPTLIAMACFWGFSR